MNRDGLNNNTPVRLFALTDDEGKHIDGLHLLTAKPVLYVINVFDYEKDKSYMDAVTNYSTKEDSTCVVISNDIEAEMSQMEPAERKIYISGDGNRRIRA